MFSRPVRLGFGMAVLLVLAGTLWFAMTSRESRRARLPDGREILVRSVSYGREQSVTDGATWKRVLSDILPTNITTALGWRSLRLTDGGTNDGP